MKRHHFFLVAIIAIFSASAIAFQSKIEIVEQFDNLRVVAFVDVIDVNDSPEWNPSLSPIPLTVSNAIQAVKDFNHGSSQDIDIKEIEIRQIPRHEKRWHYLIKVANSHLKTKYDIYVILMSGKVIPGIIEPDGLK